MTKRSMIQIYVDMLLVLLVTFILLSEFDQAVSKPPRDYFVELTPPDNEDCGNARLGLSFFDPEDELIALQTLQKKGAINVQGNRASIRVGTDVPTMKLGIFLHGLDATLAAGAGACHRETWRVSLHSPSGSREGALDSGNAFFFDQWRID